MEENVTVTLDFSKCQYISEVYLEMREKMKWEDWYGPNLDALWDAVTGMMYTPANITIRSATKREELQQSVDDIIAVFREAEEEYHEITVVIKK